MRGIFRFAPMCVKTSTDVILPCFRLEQSPWQCEGKQRCILPNTCLAPTIEADKAKRWARNIKENSKSARISGRPTVTGKLLLAITTGAAAAGAVARATTGRAASWLSACVCVPHTDSYCLSWLRWFKKMRYHLKLPTLHSLFPAVRLLFSHYREYDPCMWWAECTHNKGFCCTRPPLCTV